MTDTVEISFSHPHGEHAVGDRVAVAAGEARRLVQAGVAVYPTKADALEAEGEGGVEKTQTAVRKRAARGT